MAVSLYGNWERIARHSLRDIANTRRPIRQPTKPPSKRRSKLRRKRASKPLPQRLLNRSQPANAQRKPRSKKPRGKKQPQPRPKLRNRKLSAKPKPRPRAIAKQHYSPAGKSTPSRRFPRKPSLQPSRPTPRRPRPS